jgi:hypothetical protein
MLKDISAPPTVARTMVTRTIPIRHVLNEGQTEGPDPVGDDHDIVAVATVHHLGLHPVMVGTWVVILAMGTGFSLGGQGQQKEEEHGNDSGL